MMEERHINYTPADIGSIWRPKWFLATRFLAVLGVAVALVGSAQLFRVETVHYPALWLLCGALLLTNILYATYYKFARIDSTLEARILEHKVSHFITLQINTDLITLTLMLHFSGGVTNPFILYYFFHTILSSILLSKRSAYIEATVAVVLLSSMALLEGYGVIAHYDLFCPLYYMKPMFIYGMIFATSSAIYIAVYMATSIVDSLRHHEEELEKALIRQRRLEAEKSRFLEIVAHDLKSPLAAIDTMVSSTLSVHGDKILPDVKKLLERIPTRTNGLIEYIKELLEFSRINKIEALGASFMTLNILEVIESALEIVRPQAIGKNINLILNAPASLQPVMGNAELLERMSGNLFSNAIRYTDKGGTVTVTVSDAPGAVVLSVEDTGIGIPEQSLPHIFKDFFRADNAKKFNTSGTGLGMSIIKSVIDKHDARIEVDSEIDRGSIFTVTLPALKL